MPYPEPDASASSRASRAGLVLAVVAPALLTLIVGLTHPVALNASTAEWWRDLHIVLLPMFPLIGAAPWFVARRVARPWRWIAGLGGFLFAVFYTSLDVLAGIAAGAVQLDGHPEANASLYAIAHALGPIGGIGLAVGWAAATIGVMRITGVRAFAGLLAVVGALLVLKSHVYFPVGTFGLALLIVGGAVLALLPRTRTAP
jgi:hypothetical protein